MQLMTWPEPFLGSAEQTGPLGSSGTVHRATYVRNYLTATRDTADPFLKAVMQAALTCFCFWIIHLVMRPSSGMASEQRSITSDVQAETCSSVYASAGT